MILDTGRRMMGPQGWIGVFHVAIPEDNAEGFEVVELLNMKEDDFLISSNGTPYLLVGVSQAVKISRSNIPFVVYSRIKIRHLVGLTEDEIEPEEQTHEASPLHPLTAYRPHGDDGYAKLIPRGALLRRGRDGDDRIHLPR